MATKRIYLVGLIAENGDSVDPARASLIEAASQAQAIRHAVYHLYKAEVATTRQVADLYDAGVRVEVAGDEPAGEGKP